MFAANLKIIEKSSQSLLALITPSIVVFYHLRQIDWLLTSDWPSQPTFCVTSN